MHAYDRYIRINIKYLCIKMAHMYFCMGRKCVYKRKLWTFRYNASILTVLYRGNRLYASQNNYYSHHFTQHIYTASTTLDNLTWSHALLSRDKRDYEIPRRIWRKNDRLSFSSRKFVKTARSCTFCALVFNLAFQFWLTAT